MTATTAANHLTLWYWHQNEQSWADEARYPATDEGRAAMLAAARKLKFAGLDVRCTDGDRIPTT